jgi:glycosyltransferase involved in cell wall biosynthesis
MSSPPTRALRVLYVTQDDLAKNSGYAFRVDRIRRALETAGCRVTVIGFSSGAPAIACVARRSRSPLRRLWPFWQGLVRPADCVVVTSVGAPYNGLYALAVRLAGKRVIYDMHDPVVYSLPELFGRGLPMRLAMRWIQVSERLLDRVARATIASSRRGAELYAEWGWRGPISIAYNIRRDADTASAAGSDLRTGFGWGGSTVVVYAGGWQQNVRGLERQIEGAIEARARGADVVLLLIGFGDRRYFERLGAPLVAKRALRFLDDVPPERLAGVLRECDVAVSCEPIGYLMQSKYFDYLCCGVRVAAIDDGRDLIGVFGGLVDRFDGTVAGLADYLARSPRRLSDDEVSHARAVTRALDRATDEAVAQIAFAAGNVHR